MGRISSQDFKSVDGGKLKLTINSTSEDAMVFELQNTNYHLEKWGKIKTFVMLVAFLGFSVTMNITNVYIFAIAIVLLIINIILLAQLVDSETLSIIRNFTVQKTIKRAFGREENLLIPRNELKSVVINEVFDNQRVIFMMQLILQSAAEAGEPKIIPLFDNLKPNRECSEFVYKIIRNKLRQ